MKKLLTRDEFRNAVFTRDNHKCVVCSEPAVDAHHILERRLFHDGGYYVDNGVSLCSTHHMEAEMTLISPNELRDLANIHRLILPDHLYRDYDYDKWGNIVLPNGRRLKGELFYDESVQKVLAKGNVLDLYDRHVKYPRTYHLPWSTLSKDDRIMEDDSFLQGKRVIVTLKMDGENTTMYNDHIHARSIDSGSHETRDWVKGLWGRINWMIDPDMRVCGENLFAVHSIKYKDLPSFFLVFSIWVKDVCLSWDETVELAEILGLKTVPVIYDGMYDKEAVHMAMFQYREQHEGYVVRVADEFTYGQFRKAVGKFVHPAFRQTLNQSHGHWISKKIEVNGLIQPTLTS